MAFLRIYDLTLSLCRDLRLALSELSRVDPDLARQLRRALASIAPIDAATDNPLHRVIATLVKLTR